MGELRQVGTDVPREAHCLRLLPTEMPGHRAEWTIGGVPYYIVVWTEEELIRVPRGQWPPDAIPLPGVGLVALRHDRDDGSTQTL